MKDYLPIENMFHQMSFKDLWMVQFKVISYTVRKVLADFAVFD